MRAAEPLQKSPMRSRWYWSVARVDGCAYVGASGEGGTTVTLEAMLNGRIWRSAAGVLLVVDEDEDEDEADEPKRARVLDAMKDILWRALSLYLSLRVWSDGDGTSSGYVWGPGI